ncbi:hypothetical protein BDZ89DRAFT_1042400 [Hymenopellis radicata]|nr:hypothetical protein BDZ89DRAFT_1042400 [Hymenopellis radicata]
MEPTARAQVAEQHAISPSWNQPRAGRESKLGLTKPAFLSILPPSKIYHILPPPRPVARTTNNSTSAALETLLPVATKPRASGSRSPTAANVDPKKNPGKSASSTAPSSPTTPTNTATKARSSSKKLTGSPAPQPTSPKTTIPAPASPASSSAKKRKSGNVVATPHVAAPLVSSPLATNHPINSPTNDLTRPGSGSSSTPTQASVTTPVVDATTPVVKPKAPPKDKGRDNAPQNPAARLQQAEPAFLADAPVVSTTVTSESSLSATPPLPQEDNRPLRQFLFRDEAAVEPVAAPMPRSTLGSPRTSQIFESVTAGMRVTRESQDKRGDSLLLEGPGNTYSPRDEPLTMSAARFHAPWNPLDVEEDPLTPFGAVNGFLPRRTAEETIWIRELIIRVFYPHTGNFWRNLPEAIEEALGMIITRQELVRIVNPLAPNALPLWGLSMEYLEQLAHVALAVAQCLDSFHSFLWSGDGAFQMDPGWKLLRLLEQSSNAPRILITFGVWKERLRHAQQRLNRYLLGLQGMWNESQRIRLPELESTVSEVRTHEGTGGGRTEVGKYLRRPEYYEIARQIDPGEADYLSNPSVYGMPPSDNANYEMVEDATAHIHHLIESIPVREAKGKASVNWVRSIHSSTSESVPVIPARVPKPPRQAPLQDPHPISVLPGVGRFQDFASEARRGRIPVSQADHQAASTAAQEYNQAEMGLPAGMRAGPGYIGMEEDTPERGLPIQRIWRNGYGGGGGGYGDGGGVDDRVVMAVAAMAAVMVDMVAAAMVDTAVVAMVTWRRTRWRRWRTWRRWWRTWRRWWTARTLRGR